MERDTPRRRTPPRTPAPRTTVPRTPRATLPRDGARRDPAQRPGTGRPQGKPQGRAPRRPAPRPGRPRYLVRWILVLVVLAAVVTGIVLGVKALAGWVGDLRASGAAAAVEPSEEPTGDYVPVDCTDADVDVTLATDSTSPRVGSTVRFTVSIVHVGVNPCTLDAGGAARELLVTSGADRVWSSADCDTAGSRMLLLAPGNQDVGEVAWATNRSGPECAEGLPAPGAGTYQAVVNVSGLTTAPVVLNLTGSGGSMVPPEVTPVLPEALPEGQN